LLGRIDGRVRAAARRAIELVDVAAALIHQHAAALSGAVGKITMFVPFGSPSALTMQATTTGRLPISGGGG
jgi:hypothetical protein